MSKIRSKPKKKKKQRKKIKNWSRYNVSLVNRGSVTFWIDEDSTDKWHYDGPPQKGGQYVFSDDCIECIMALKAVFNLGYRQLEGFTNSILCLMGLDLESPSYSQISRRSRELNIALGISVKEGESMHIVFDSTGLKIYGQGEWQDENYGKSKRKSWRKLHIGVDEQTGLIHAQVLTDNSTDDASQLEPMLDQVEGEVDKASADGAYDKDKCWDCLEERQITGLIPPREDAAYWTGEDGNLLDHQRNKILEYIDSSSMSKWKAQSGYTRRNLSETAMMRFKTTFGAKLFSREFKRQKTEAAIKVKVLNKMTLLGKPIYEKVA